MITRVQDKDFLQRIANEVIDWPVFGFDAEELVLSSVVLSSDEDIAIFEPQRKGVYRGHYLFKNSKGRAAINLSKLFLKEMFETYSASLICGLTPVDNKAALWMNRQLGFKSGGIVHHPQAGELELFTLHKKDFTE